MNILNLKTLNLKTLKMTVAFAASALGVLMPWRLRIIYSEALGWVAQLLPPSLTALKDDRDGAPQ